MLSTAFTASLLLGVTPLLVTAAQPPYSFRNNTTTGTTVVQVTKTPAGPGCAANYPSSKASPTQSSATASATTTLVNTTPSVTLSPNVHWSYDTKSVGNVIPVDPQKGSELYYGISDPSKSGHFAFLTYYFTLPSVNIDHTDYITAKYHPLKGITASFKSQDAFKHALNSWSVKNGLILIAHVPGCGDYAKGERCYFNVTDLDFKSHDLSVIVGGSSKHPDEVITSGETEWGWWDAKKETTTSATPSGNTNSSSSPYSISRKNPPSTAGFIGNLNATKKLDCHAPADSINGLPTACVGTNFDQILDKNLGYSRLSAKSERFLKDVTFGNNTRVFSNATSLSPTAARMQRRSLARRGFWSNLGNFFKEAHEATFDFIADHNTISADMDVDFSFEVPNPDSSIDAVETLLGDLVQVQSPWGDAILLQSLKVPDTIDIGIEAQMNIYCVDCGISGHAKVTGRARWSPFNGIEEGHIELNANMKFLFKIGVEGDAEIQNDFYTDIYTYDLPAICFGVVSIGPYITVGARVSVSASATGSFLAGAEMGLQDSHVVLDLVDPSKNDKTGWTPYFKPIYEVDGQVDATAELGLPVGLKCGLKIAFWEKAVGIVDEPSIKGTAELAGSASLDSSGTTEANLSDVNGCAGIMAQLSWRNRMWLELSNEIPLLDSSERVLFSKCIGEATPSEIDAPPSDIYAPKAMDDPSPPMRAGKYNKTLALPSHRNQSSHRPTSKAPLPVKVYEDFANTRPAQLLNPQASVKIVSCANGNLYAVQNGRAHNEYCFDLWETTKHSEVVYDGVHRPMLYYRDIMQTLGVSRLRVSDASEVPQTSDAVVFTPIRSPENQSLYVAVSSSHEVFYPVVCDYVDKSASKIFLTRDPIRGVETLQRKDVMYSVTGGEVAKCQLLAVKA